MLVMAVGCLETVVAASNFHLLIVILLVVLEITAGVLLAVWVEKRLNLACERARWSMQDELTADDST